MHTSDNLGLTIVDNGDPADLETVSDDFEALDAFAGDIATVESSPTVAAHSVGEFLLYEGRLYKVTAAISAGTALTLGTNVSAANIGSEIKTLQDSVLPHIVLTSKNFSHAANTWEYTGLSVSIPAGSIFAIYGLASYTNSQHTGLFITGANSTSINQMFAVEDGQCPYVSFCGYMPVDITIYLYVRYEKAETDYVRISGWYI